MLTNVITDHAAWICALFGMACYAAWSVFRTRSMMLLIQLGALIGFSLHYALLGVATAAAVNALGAVQIAASLLLGTRPSLRWVGYALAAVMVAASVFTWQGVVSALAVTGMVLVAVGRVQTNADAMRLIVLASCPLWLAHDLVVESPVAIADALSLAVGVGGIAWRHFKPVSAAVAASSRS